MDQSPTDEELMRRLAADDANAMEVLMERYEGPVLNAIYWSIGDYYRAEEVAQEVFVTIYRQRARYKPRAKFVTWLFRIVRNRCLNEVRDRATAQQHVVQVTQGPEDLPAPRSASPDAQAERAETQQALLNAVASLPENQRTAFVLAKIEGFSYQEIAETMGITLPSCESLIHRARLNLRDRLRPLLDISKSASFS
jgi:RNA polymerase sigma-70 factor (ECF subfamily)